MAARSNFAMPGCCIVNPSLNTVWLTAIGDRRDGRRYERTLMGCV